VTAALFGLLLLWAKNPPKRTVEFSVPRATDVEVAIVDGESRGVRHLVRADPMTESEKRIDLR
jgi:hypothetical protein